MSISSLLKKIIKNKSELKNLFLIKKSRYFNKKWYLNTYPDVKKAKIDPAVHYLKYGWKEYRDPSPLFSTKQYLMQNKDVAYKGINPLVHFEKYGKKENRKIFFSGTSNDYMTLSENEKNMYDIVKNSNMFDKDWYGRYYHDAGYTDLVEHYIKSSLGFRPNPYFYKREYLLLNPDILKYKMDPFIHYVLYGKYENRAVSFANAIINHKENDMLKIKSITNRNIYKNNIVSIFICKTTKGYFSVDDINILNELKKISDYIILCVDEATYINMDSEIECAQTVVLINNNQCELNSVNDIHRILRTKSILKETDNVLLINQDWYILGHLNDVINKYRSSKCDYFGYKRKHNDTYGNNLFYIFSYNIWSNNIFSDFLDNDSKVNNNNNCIFTFKQMLHNIMAKEGFNYDYYWQGFTIDMSINNIYNQFIQTYINKYNPMIEKSFMNLFINNKLVDNKIFSKQYDCYIHSNFDVKEKYFISKYNIYNNYNTKLAELQEKFSNGKKINAIFLVNMTSMFPAENLMLLMKDDNRYNVKLYVIPDVRFGEKEMYRIYNDTFKELKSKYEYTEHAITIDIKTEKIVEYKNVIKYTDLVCYPSPYDVSYSLYNPYYAAQENILSIHINYGFFRSKYDRIIYSKDNYSNFWKVFLETEINYNEYRIYGQCEGKNSVIIGYAKMDRLKQYMDSKQKNIRKKIIIAPHHSVDGGMNKTLSLSNFEKYADLFLELPKKYPDIDFIFRPHPVLFTVLKRANHWGEEKVKAYIEKFTSYENVTYSTEGDYLEVFANSDGIIQDSGSFLVEYFYTGKPCCYMLKSKNDIHDKFNELGIKCLEHTYIAYNQEEILKFLDEVIIKEDDYMKNDRIAFAEKEIMINYPNVSMKIYEYINNSVGKNNG